MKPKLNCSRQGTRQPSNSLLYHSILIKFNAQTSTNAMKNFLTVSLEPHVSTVMEVSLVPVQLVSLEMAERVNLVVQVKL